MRDKSSSLVCDVEPFAQSGKWPARIDIAWSGQRSVYRHIGLQFRSLVAHISNIQTGGAAQLFLNRDVPLLNVGHTSVRIVYDRLNRRAGRTGASNGAKRCWLSSVGTGSVFVTPCEMIHGMDVAVRFE